MYEGIVHITDAQYDSDEKHHATAADKTNWNEAADEISTNASHWVRDDEPTDNLIVAYSPTNYVPESYSLSGQLAGISDALITGYNESDFDNLSASTLFISPIPSGNNSTGTKGQRAYSSGFMYNCIETDTWVKVTAVTAF